MANYISSRLEQSAAGKEKRLRAFTGTVTAEAGIKGVYGGDVALVVTETSCI